MEWKKLVRNNGKSSTKDFDKYLALALRFYTLRRAKANEVSRPQGVGRGVVPSQPHAVSGGESALVSLTLRCEGKRV